MLAVRPAYDSWNLGLDEERSWMIFYAYVFSLPVYTTLTFSCGLCSGCCAATSLQRPHQCSPRRNKPSSPRHPRTKTHFFLKMQCQTPFPPLCIRRPTKPISVYHACRTRIFRCAAYSPSPSLSFYRSPTPLLTEIYFSERERKQDGMKS